MRKIRNPSLTRGHRPADEPVRQGSEGALVLGLEAFERISAVEGIALSREMKLDLEMIGAESMTGEERTRFIVKRYGKR